MSENKPSIDTEIDEISVVEAGSVNRVVLEAFNKEKFKVTLYDGTTQKGSGIYESKTGYLRIRNHIGYGFRRSLENGEPSYGWINYRGNEDGGINYDARLRTEKLVKALDKAVEKINFNIADRTIEENNDGTEKKINVVGDSISVYTTDIEGKRVGSYLDVTGSRIDFENKDKDGKLKTSFHDNTYTDYTKNGTTTRYKADEKVTQKEEITDDQQVSYTIEEGKMTITKDAHTKDVVYFDEDVAKQDGEKPPFPIRRNDPYILRFQQDGSKEDFSPHKGELKNLLYKAISDNNQRLAYDILSHIVENPLGETRIIDEVNRVVNNEISSPVVFALDNGNFAVAALYTDSYTYRHSFKNDDSKYVGLTYSIIDPENKKIAFSNKTERIETEHSWFDSDKYLGNASMAFDVVDGKANIKLFVGSNKMDSMSIAHIADKDYIEQRASHQQNNHTEMFNLRDSVFKEVHDVLDPIISSVNETVQKIKQAYQKDEAENTITNQQIVLQEILKQNKLEK